MKRNFTFLIAAVALLAILAIPMGMWGQVTIGYGDTFSPALPTTSNDANTSSTAHVDETASNFAFKEQGIYKGTQNNYLMFVQNKGFLYNTEDLGTITSVAVTYSSGTSTSGKAGVYFGNAEQSTYTTTSNNTIKGQSQTDTWTNSTSGYGYFQFSTSNKNVQVTQIVITYTSGGGGTTTYTVTLGDDNSTLTQSSVGASVTLPTRDDIGNYSFEGWSETNVEDETTIAPTIIPAGTYTPTANITLYPVYTRTEAGGSTPTAFSVGNTGDYAIVSEEQDGKYYALPSNPTVNNGKITAQEIIVSEINGVKYVTPTDANGFTWTIASATDGFTLSDGSKYIYHSNGGASGTNLTYGNSTNFTWAFTIDEDCVKMAGMSGTTTNNRGLLFNGTTIGGYALSNWGNSGYYKSMILPVFISETTYYWSNPEPPTVAKPVITVAENPFLFSTTVTITCATEGATIKYSYDGEAWNDYSTTLTINETKTIYAKGVNGTDESSIASVTATKNLADPTITIDATGITNTDVYLGTDAGNLSASITYNNAPIQGATVTWSGNNNAVATINANSGAVTLSGKGVVIFTATFAGDDNYCSTTATYQLTVTSSAPSVDYAVLPFVWAGGASVDFEEMSGVTLVGNGTDYNSNDHSPYLIKFDGTGDYIMIKTDSQPGAVTIGVKMVGGANTSTIKVQGSSDGQTFDDGEELTISGSQNAIVNLTSSRSFNADVRYVRLYFIKGSNVGVGPITIRGIESFELIIAGYTNGGGWNLIASPVVSIDPVNAGMITDDYVSSNVTPDNGTYDLYRFNQSAKLEWENYRVHSFALESGKGYLYASKEGVSIQFVGTPYNSNGEIPLVYDEDKDFAGWNLIGNPFGVAATLDMPYYRMNDNQTTLGAKIEDDQIAAMEGVFVYAYDAEHEQAIETATFTRAGRSNNASQGFVNLNVEQNASVVDNVIVRFDEGRSLPKLQLFKGSAEIFITKNGKDYAIVSSEAQGEMPVNFKAEENGTYTLSINTENVEMNYLHLIDNMTGMDVDLLQTPSYTFDATTNDYTSRFRLVFSANNVDGPSTGSGTFAFYSNGNWVIGNEGEATLQVIDVNGRIVSNETINGSVNKTIVATPGVYMLRLVNGNEVKTQKIVVR